MIGIFSSQGAGAIEGVAARRGLLAFDFDGTLAPIVENRAAALMRGSTRLLLQHAAKDYPVAVISGRARADLAARLSDLPLVAVIGNHGAETAVRRPDARVRRRVGAWASALQATLGGVRGLEIEDKGLSLSVHYRRAADPEAVRRRVFSAASALPDARLTGGKAVLNLSPIELPTKGAALEGLVRSLAPGAVLFAGDDVTDEDAFESPVVDVPVRVGREPESAARYFLEDQGQVDALLEALLAARARAR